MSVINNGSEIIITIPADLIATADIQNFLDLLRYKFLVSKSQATPEDVAQLSDEINKELAKANRIYTNL